MVGDVCCPGFQYNDGKCFKVFENGQAQNQCSKETLGSGRILGANTENEGSESGCDWTLLGPFCYQSLSGSSFNVEACSEEIQAMDQLSEFDHLDSIHIKSKLHSLIKES